MKILLLGNTGQLGWELNRTLLTLGDLVAMDYPQINMADEDNIRSNVRKYEPDLIVNATAYTDVDKAESEPELAMTINGTGPGILSKEVKRLGGAIIHYSTDYVFDGTKCELYSEEDQPNPLSVYGKTKLAGEKAIQSIGGVYLIFRTSWVYSLRRPCFVTKVLKWAQENETLRIVDDQISNPTWARSLAEATAQVIAQSFGDSTAYLESRSGLYHLSGKGSCSRFDWAKAILELDPQKEKHKTVRLLPAKSRDFKTPAERPKYSSLDTEKFQITFKLTPANWKTDLLLSFSMD